MTNRDLDRRCAEILGWTRIESFANPEKIFGHPPDPGVHIDTMLKIPLYSTSLDASRELIEWGLREWPNYIPAERFAEELSDKFGRALKNYGDAIVCALRLTPRQIAESFVQCFGDEPKIVKWAYDDPVTGKTQKYDHPTGCAGEYPIEVEE